jgi:hypothetical protein
MDGSKSMPGKARKQHSGLQDPLGRYYEPMLEAFSMFSATMYDVHRG